jgi:hypothetical protein
LLLLSLNTIKYVEAHRGSRHIGHVLDPVIDGG